MRLVCALSSVLTQVFGIVSVALMALALPALAPQAHADWDDRPGFDFHPQSSAEAPCGTGTPPRGHFAAEVAPASRPNGITLTVRQDARRLCYVVDNVAAAPVIRVRQGDLLVITLKNEIADPAAIGRYVAIGQRGRAEAPVAATEGFYPVVAGTPHRFGGLTNLHLHGFAVPPVAPQDEVLKTCADPAAPPVPGAMRCGRREVTYRYRIPKDMPPGLYWYHPHIHGEAQAQILMGLSGAIVVEGPADDARRAAGIQDRIFVVRQTQDLDLKTTGQQTNGQIAAPTPVAPATALPPLSRASTGPLDPGRGRMDGFAIDTRHELGCTDNAGIDEISLNGAKVVDGDAQDADLAPVEIAAGTTQLWRIVNAATDAFLDLALIDEQGQALPLTILARDGAPLEDDAGRPLPQLATNGAQLVPPAGRIEFLIAAPPQGRKAYLVTHGVDTGCTGDRVPERKLVLVTAAPTATAAVAPSAAAADAPASHALPAFAEAGAPNLFSGLRAAQTQAVRTIAFAEYPRPGMADQTDFYIMERKPGAVLRPFEMGGPPAITVKAGTTEEWVVENWTRELHAFHIHQVHFRVLAVDGRPVSEPAMLDTVTVPYARASDPSDPDAPLIPGRVRIKLRFPEALAGDIPFHCHLVDHEDNGMMAVLRVLPGGTDRPEQKADLGAGWRPPLCHPMAAPN